MKKKVKTYELNTIAELFNLATSENIDGLFKDLKNTANAFVKVKEKSENIKYRFKTFTWIDDGKDDITLFVEF